MVSGLLHCYFLVFLIILLGQTTNGTKQLYEAIQSDDVELVKEIVGQNSGLQEVVVSVDESADETTTPLHLAAYHGASHVVSFLLVGRKIPLNVTTNNWPLKDVTGIQPIHVACLTGQQGVIGLLVDAARKQNVNLQTGLMEVKDSQGRTPIFYAAVKSDRPVFVKLIDEYGADFQQVRDKFGMQPIHFAIAQKNVAAVDAFLRKGGDTVSRALYGGDDKKTISHLAAEYNFAEMLTVFLQHFKLQAVDGRGQTPSCWMAINGSIDFARKFVEKISPVLINDGKCVYFKGKPTQSGPPLHMAAFHRRRSYLESLWPLLTPSTAISSKDSFGGTLVHAMAMSDGSEGVENDEATLLTFFIGKDGQILERTDNIGRTPFLTAAKSSSLRFAKILQKFGANVTATDKNGYSAIHHAEDAVFADYLLKTLGAGVNAKAKPSLVTPLLVAVKQKKSIEFIDYLIKQKADINAAGADGKTVLHVAVEVDNVAAIDYFVPKVANVSAVDNAGRTPLLYAIELGRVAVAKKMVAFLQPDALAFQTPITQDTALHLACQLNQSEIVRVLMQKRRGLAYLTNAANQTALHVAVSHQHLSVVNALSFPLKSDIPGKLISLLRQKDNHGRNVIGSLVLQCGHDGTEIAKIFVPYLKAEMLEDMDNFGESPVEAAVRRNCLSMVKFLLRLHLNPPHNACLQLNRNGLTPLHVAVRMGFDVIASAMVATGKCSYGQTDTCGIVAKQSSSIGDRCNEPPSVANGILASSNDSDVHCIGAKLQLVCDGGYVVRGSDMVECTDQGQWVINGYCESLPVRQSQCGSMEYWTCGQEDLLYSGRLAVRCGLNDGRWHVQGKCLEQKILSRFEERLFMAARYGNLTAIGDLLDLGVEINARKGAKQGEPWNGYTALTVAAFNGETAAVDLLLNRGARVNVQDNDGWTPLMFASHYGYTETVALLLRREADPKIRSNGTGCHQTALTAACQKTGKPEIVEMLLASYSGNINDKVTCPNSINNNNKQAELSNLSALQLAAEFDRIDIVSLLLEKGADRTGCNHPLCDEDNWQ